jgi:hypothetical protein
LYSLALIVGQDEGPFPLVRCADFRRAENSSRRFVTHPLQFAEGMEQNRRPCGIAPAVSGEFGADDTLDIFQENKGRSALSDPVKDVGEEVAWV